MARAARALGADTTQNYILLRGPDQILRYHGIDFQDATPAATEAWRLGEGLAIVLNEVDPDHISPLNRLGVPPADFYENDLWRMLFASFGYRRIVSMNVTRGAEHRGQLSFLRTSEDPWVPADALAAEVSAELCAAFREAWSVEERLAPPDGALTLTTDGRVVADEPIAAWVAAHDALPWLAARADAAPRPSLPTLGRADLQWAPAAQLRVSAIPGGGFLYTFARATPMELPPILARLTDLQRRVASLAAAGATIPEIARELDRSPETVREHLARVYERLGIASRSELASAAGRFLL